VYRQLVISSACDHYTRVIRGGTLLPVDATVVGILFGTVDTHGSISVVDATDIIIAKNGQGEEVMVTEEIEKKVQLWTAVYPQNVLLGWYTFHSAVTHRHFHLHNSLAAYIASDKPIGSTTEPSSTSSSINRAQHPLAFLLFDTAVSKDDIESIPLKVFVREQQPVSSAETATAGQQQQQQSFFMDKQWKTSSSEVEKIAVNHIIHSRPLPKGMTALEVQNETMRISVQLLEKKVDVIIEVLEAMKEGKIPMDHQLLRRANTILQSLGTTTSNEEFIKEFDEVINNSMLLTYLQGASKNYQEMRAYNEVASMLGEKSSSSSSSAIPISVAVGGYFHG
jgi:hypothetical protein